MLLGALNNVESLSFRDVEMIGFKRPSNSILPKLRKLSLVHSANLETLSITDLFSNDNIQQNMTSLTLGGSNITSISKFWTKLLPLFTSLTSL